MPFSAYDSEAVRRLSCAFADAMDAHRKSAGRPLSANETALLSKRMVDNLMKTYDSGERDPEALKRAAME